MISQNLMALMAWGDRMLKKYGHPRVGIDWCRKLAYHVGEAGNDSPSDHALTIARDWENSNPELLEGNHAEEKNG